MEKKVLDYNSLVSLRPGEKLTIGPIEVRRAGIVWVVKNGEARRSFEKAPIAFDWINRELEKVNGKGKRAKKAAALDVVVEQANGKTTVVFASGAKDPAAKKAAKIEKKRAKQLKVSQIKEEKALLKARTQIVKRAKKAEREAKRARNKIRKFFEFVIYTLSWVMFMASGFILFGLQTMPFIPVEIADGIAQVKVLIHELLTDTAMFTSVYAGAAILGIAVLFFSLISVQLQKSTAAKVWGLILSVLGVAGTGYAVFINFADVADIFANMTHMSNIIKIAFMGATVLQPALVLLVGRKAKKVR